MTATNTPEERATRHEERAAWHLARANEISAAALPLFSAGDRVVIQGDEIGDLGAAYIGLGTVTGVSDPRNRYDYTVQADGYTFSIDVRETEIAPAEEPAPDLPHGFAPGERVVYVGDFIARWKGRTGTVTEASDSHRATNVRVRWDLDGPVQGVFPESIARLQP